MGLVIPIVIIILIFAAIYALGVLVISMGVPLLALAVLTWFFASRCYRASYDAVGHIIILSSMVLMVLFFTAGWYRYSLAFFTGVMLPGISRDTVCEIGGAGGTIVTKSKCERRKMCYETYLVVGPKLDHTLHLESWMNECVGMRNHPLDDRYRAFLQCAREEATDQAGASACFKKYK